MKRENLTIGGQQSSKGDEMNTPPNHPDGTVHKSKTEAEEAEAAERHP